MHKYKFVGIFLTYFYGEKSGKYVKICLSVHIWSNKNIFWHKKECENEVKYVYECIERLAQ